METKPSSLLTFSKAYVHDSKGELTEVTFTNVRKGFLDRFTELDFRHYDMLNEKAGDMFQIEQVISMEFGVVASDHEVETFDECYKVYANHLGSENEELLIVEIYDDL